MTAVNRQAAAEAHCAFRGSHRPPQRREAQEENTGRKCVCAVMTARAERRNPTDEEQQP